MIGDAKLQKIFEMKIFEIINFNKELIKRFQQAGIRIEDVMYIDLYDEYLGLKSRGDKKTYVVALLADKYGISERKVYGLIKHFESDCKSRAV